MALIETPLCNFGWKAPDFLLPAIDGNTYSLEKIRGAKGTLIMFICNHCPYVKGITDRLASEIAVLQDAGIGVIAISANDATSYPEDSFTNMKLFSQQHRFTFPYAYDETQETAKAYDAICTPDFFGFNASLELQYRGRLDSSGKDPAGPETKRELVEAMLEIAKCGKGPELQIPSMGCSLKWR